MSDEEKDIDSSGPARVKRVVVVDIEMKWSSMVVFMIKWSLAAIPALVVISLLYVGGLAVVGSVVAWRVGRAAEARLEVERGESARRAQEEAAERTLRESEDQARRMRDAALQEERNRLASEAAAKAAEDQLKATNAQQLEAARQALRLHQQISSWCGGNLAALRRYSTTAEQFVADLEASSFRRRPECSVLADATLAITRKVEIPREPIELARPLGQLLRAYGAGAERCLANDAPAARLQFAVATSTWHELEELFNGKEACR